MMSKPPPDYVWYRGVRRRVWRVERAQHQGHRHYILRYKDTEIPDGAHTMAFGHRGQKGYLGVRVRADTTRPYMRSVENVSRFGDYPSVEWQTTTSNFVKTCLLS